MPGSPNPQLSYRTRIAPSRQNWMVRTFLAFLLLLGFLAGGALAWGIAHPEHLSWIGLTNEIPAPRSEAKAKRLEQATIAATPAPDSSPFAINPLAKLSYVPVIMYHDVVSITKQIWFDTTAAELRQHFEAIRDQGVTPITMDQLYKHLHDGEPLPKKAILLTFDDAYLGLYENAFPLLKEFNYPAAYFVQTGFVGVPTSKEHFTWDQMQEMDQSGLIQFAPHTINHPDDLRTLDDTKLKRELVDGKRIMQEKMGHPMDYFAYPAGNRDERVMKAVADAGYKMAFTMDSGYAGQSVNLLEVRRFNQYRVTEAILGAQTVLTRGLPDYPLTVITPLEVKTEVLDRVKTTTIRGGRAATVHAEQRYNVGTLKDRYHATAGINGGFFSIPWINSSSNIMVGPVMSANEKTFIPGRPEDVQAIRGRPLVLLGQDRISFIPFDPISMNDLAGIQQLMPDVTDLFVAGVWLVKEGQPLDRDQLESFRLASAAEFRPRAFLGLDKQGMIVAGTTETHVNSEILAQILPQTGIQEAVLLDSGFSTSLIYEDQVLATGHATALQPSRPVPHVILLYDMPKIWAQASQQQSTLPDTPTSKLQVLVNLAPASEQVAAQAVLENVLSGQKVLRRGERGGAIMALQSALVQLASSKGRLDLLPSGPDGVYGQELANAVGALGLVMGSTPLPEATASPAQPAGIPTPTPLVAATLEPEPFVPVDVIDAPILRNLLESVQQAAPAVLVSQNVPRKPVDLTRKPTHKLSS